MSVRKSTLPVARNPANTPAVKSASSGKKVPHESVLESLDKVLKVMDLPTLLAQCDQLRQSGQQADDEMLHAGQRLRYTVPLNSTSFTVNT